MNKKEIENKIKLLENELLQLKENLNSKNTNYESIILIRENIKLKSYNKIIDTSKNILGDIEEFEEMGLKRLAYEIQNNTKAYYIRYKWTGNEKDVEEFERFCRKENNIIKFLTVRVDY